ncbi:unnamed protein product [Rotaria sp. Silwood2]|nr:unnamed protein product [Rotaria sp. Silwood2]
MHLHQYIKCVYLVLACFAASSAIVHNVIARNFSVCEVEPGKIVHPEVQYLSNEDLQRWAGKNETLQLENIQLVHPLAGNIGYRIANAFVGTVLIAYSHHYSLELSVEDIWVAIAQGVSIHLNENAEKYRQLFVSHEDISISPSRSRRRRDFKRQLIDNKSHDTETFTSLDHHSSSFDGTNSNGIIESLNL